MNKVVLIDKRNGREISLPVRQARAILHLVPGRYMTRDMQPGLRSFPDAPVPELDSAGVAWDAEVHAESRAKNKDGTWRKRPGGSKAE